MVVPPQHAEFVRSFRAHAQDYVTDTVEPAAAKLVELWHKAQRADDEIHYREHGFRPRERTDLESAAVEQYGKAIRGLPDELEAQAIRWADGDETAFADTPLLQAIRQFAHALGQKPAGAKGTRMRADSQEAWAPFFHEANRVLATLNSQAIEDNVLRPAADELVRPPREQ